MKISLKAFMWAAFCLLAYAGNAQAQEEEPKWKVGGWLTQSFTWNPENPQGGFNGPVTFTDRANEYQLNQAYTYIEGTTDTGGSGIDLGGRVDFLYGTDYRFTTATGLEQHGNGSNNWNGEDHRFYGLAMPQFYAEIAINDLKTKIGHFYSPVGFFVVPATGNFFNTMPYTFQYGEPFTHTGFLSTYQITDDLALGGGLIKGWDNFDNSFNPHVGFLDTMTWKINDRSSLAIVHTNSQEFSNSGTSGGFSYRFLQTLVYSNQLTENLQYVLHTDYGHQDNATAAGRSAAWYGANQYLFYKINDRLSYGFNFEWFRDLDGFRVGNLTVPLNNGTGSTRTAPLAGGWTGNFYQITTGPKIQVTENLMIRPNARWDWYSGPRGNGANGGALPYDDGTKGTQFIFGTDVTLSF
jgi:hypothetical protein